MGKRYGTVSEMISATSDEAFKARFEKEAANRSVARALFKLRNTEGLTQEQVASKMGVAQSAISRIEHSDNDKIRFHEFENYVSALGYKISVNIHRDRNAAEWVKYHVIETRKHLRQLAELCKGDAGMSSALSGFLWEATYNFLTGIGDAASRLTQIPRPEQSETLQVITTETNSPEDATALLPEPTGSTKTKMAVA